MSPRALRDPVRVCAVDELPDGSSRIVGAGTLSIGVFNVDGSYFAFLNRCPHAGAPLCRGRVTGLAVARGPGFDIEWTRDRELLRCPWHAWEFELATGRSISDPRIRAKTYRVRVEDGEILVDIAAGRDEDRRKDDG